MIQDTSMRCIFSNTDQAKPHVEDGRSLPDVAGEKIWLKFLQGEVPPGNPPCRSKVLVGCFCLKLFGTWKMKGYESDWNTILRCLDMSSVFLLSSKVDPLPGAFGAEVRRIF